jgi:phytanoyl-CoA hydroxylase
MDQKHLTPQQLARFEHDGFVVIPGLATPARAERLRDAVAAELATTVDPAEYEADLQYSGAPQSRAAIGGATTRRLLNAYQRAPQFRDWASSPEVTNPLRQLLGPQIALSQAHHNCIMTKHPHYSSATGWHQDIRYWAFDRPELISVWLALGAEYPDNGGLSFLPGTHRMTLPPARFDSALFLREDLVENRALIASRITPTLAAGDVVLFHCRTLHAAGSNRTDQVKLSVVFSYHAADNAPLPGTRSASRPSIAL